MHSSNRSKSLSLSISLLIVLFIAVGCESRWNYQYRLDDKELRPYAAMYQVDREQYCLSELDPLSEVAIHNASYEYGSYEEEDPDVVIHLRRNNMTKSIAFAREDGGYVWIGEAETHYSGRTFYGVDGQEEEKIFIGYNLRQFGTWGSAGLTIHYFSEENEGFPDSLTCDEALLMIESWKRQAQPGN